MSSAMTSARSLAEMAPMDGSGVLIGFASALSAFAATRRVSFAARASEDLPYGSLDQAHQAREVIWVIGAQCVERHAMRHPFPLVRVIADAEVDKTDLVHVERVTEHFDTQDGSGGQFLCVLAVGQLVDGRDVIFDGPELRGDSLAVLVGKAEPQGSCRTFLFGDFASVSLRASSSSPRRLPPVQPRRWHRTAGELQ
jgi:hypothetical protein